MPDTARDPSDAILQASLAEPSAEALEIMRLSLLDWLACGLAGQGEPVAQITRQMVLDEGGAPRASLFGTGHAPARGAALVNGASSHALDYDDTHFAHIGHPSVAVLSAALAVAEESGAGLDALLRAALAGCEASVRFGLLFGRGHYQVGYHQTATAGAFGATVAAGGLMGLSRDQMLHALALVSTRAAGVKSQFGTMGKPYNAGLAAAGGVEAAALARGGFTSNLAAINGGNGFLSTHHCDGALSDAPGFLMAQVSHKFHACCHGLHATLEALEVLKPLDFSQIISIQITTHPRWMTVCNQVAPDTGLGAKFSYRVVCALSLLGHSTAALDSYSDALCTDPSVMALRDKVAVSADAQVAETAARVVVQTQAGSTEASFDLSAPMTLAERRARVQRKAAALLGAEVADRLWQGIVGGDLSALTAQMQAG